MKVAPSLPNEDQSWWPLLVAALLLPLMISDDSLWIDEAATAMHALQPSFSAWWHYLNHDLGGDALQPLGMFFSWVAGYCIGTSEWQLRSINLLWGALSLFFVWRAGRKLGVEWLPLLFVIQPFFWFYVNEARPYAVENTCGSALLWAFALFLHDEGKGLRWSFVFTIGAVALCYATVLAPIFLGLLLATATVVCVRNRWRVNARALVVPFVGVFAALPVVFYYASILHHGPITAKLWDVDVRYFGFVVYDLAGASGLGPPIEQLRHIARNASQLTANPQLLMSLLWTVLLLLIVAVLLLVPLLKRKAGNERTLILVLLAPVVLQAIAFFIIGLASHKNFWPRHLNVGFPFYVAALGVAVQFALRRGGVFSKGLSVALTLLLFYSSLRLRISSTYAKEDNRWAAATAVEISRQQRTVWWVADRSAAKYYGLKLVTTSPGDGQAFSPEDAALAGVESNADPSPDDIFLSRPDVNDADESVRKRIANDGYQLRATHPSFEWWSR